MLRDKDPVNLSRILFRLSVTVTLILGGVYPVDCQPSVNVARIGAGLHFSTFMPSYQFNYVETGNPGIALKTWVTLDKRDRIHIVPSVTAFNPTKKVFNVHNVTMTNYFFQADLNGQYVVLREGTIKLVALAGGNFSYITSTMAKTNEKEPIYDPTHVLSDSTGYFFGANMGAGIELRMSSRFDMNVSLKYILSQHSVFMISAEGVYYFRSRRKARKGSR